MRSIEEVENILKIRSKVLEFDRRIEERVESSSILYGSPYGKKRIKKCAEFCFDTRAKKILLFLWLAIPNRKNKTVVRMQIDVVHAYSSYWRFIPKKQGKLSCKTLKNREIKGHPYYSLSDNFYDKGRYLKQELVAVSVDILVDEALYTWIERV